MTDKNRPDTPVLKDGSSAKEKPLKEILIDYEEKQTLVAFATTLETIARKLKEDGQFTFTQGTERLTIVPNAELEAEFKYEKKGTKHSFEIEFEWDEQDVASGKMKIE